MPATHSGRLVLESVMQCPEPLCLVWNHRSAEHCQACGAYLFAVPRSKRKSVALFFVLLGSTLFVLLSDAEQEGAAGLLTIHSRAASRAHVFLYLVFGKWPLVIAAWVGCAVCLGLMWRVRRHPDRPPDRDPRTEGVPPPNVPVVYRGFGLSLSLVTGLVLLLTWLGTAPILPPSRGVPTPATWLILFTNILLFPLTAGVRGLARGQAQQSVEAYWSSPNLRVWVFLVWFLIAALGMLFAFTYLFTGETVALVATLSTLVVYWLCGPADFTTAT